MKHFIQTNNADQMINITNTIQEVVDNSGVKEGIIIIYIPHTTAGITINESYDPDVVTDMLSTFRRLVPVDKNYLHLEGNSHSHVKATLFGSSVTVIIESGRLKLGTWQGIFFCEFDGPRSRHFYTKIIES